MFNLHADVYFEDRFGHTQFQMGTTAVQMDGFDNILDKRATLGWPFSCRIHHCATRRDLHRLQKSVSRMWCMSDDMSPVSTCTNIASNCYCNYFRSLRFFGRFAMYGVANKIFLNEN